MRKESRITLCHAWSWWGAGEITRGVLRKSCFEATWARNGGHCGNDAPKETGGWRLEACVRRHNMWPNLLQLLWLQLLRCNILSACLQRFFLCTWKGYCNFSTERDEGNICDTTNEMYIYYIKLILCMQIYLIYMYMHDICICHSWFPVSICYWNIILKLDTDIYFCCRIYL